MAVITSAVMSIGFLHEVQAGTTTLDANDANDLREGLVASVEFTILVGCMVCYVRWFAAVNRSAAAAGAPLAYGPAAWGWFFAPVLAFWKPYRAVTELWTWRGENGHRPVPRVFVLWWVTWVASNLVAGPSLRAAASEEPDRLIHAAWLDIWSTGLAIVSALALIRVLRLLAASENEPGPRFASSMSFTPQH